jgi:hypothetical protein
LSTSPAEPSPHLAWFFSGHSARCALAGCYGKPWPRGSLPRPAIRYANPSDLSFRPGYLLGWTHERLDRNPNVRRNSCNRRPICISMGGDRRRRSCLSSRSLDGTNHILCRKPFGRQRLREWLWRLGSLRPVEPAERQIPAAGRQVVNDRTLTSRWRPPGGARRHTQSARSQAERRQLLRRLLRERCCARQKLDKPDRLRPRSPLPEARSDDQRINARCSDDSPSNRASNYGNVRA